MENIIEEARDLAAHGVKELIVIAQDITRYGTDLYGKRCLAELCRRLSEIDGIEWIRPTTSMSTSSMRSLSTRSQTTPRS